MASIYQQNTPVNLHAEDSSHPSQLGSYLTSLIFYQSLFNETRKQLPLTVKSKRNQPKTDEIITIKLLTIKLSNYQTI